MSDMAMFRQLTFLATQPGGGRLWSLGANENFRLSNDNHQDIKHADNRQELEKLFANHARLMFLRAASWIGLFTDVCGRNHLGNSGAGQSAGHAKGPF